MAEKEEIRLKHDKMSQPVTINQQWHPNQNSFFHSKLLSDTLTDEDIPQFHTVTKQMFYHGRKGISIISSQDKPGIVVQDATF